MNQDLQIKALTDMNNQKLGLERAANYSYYFKHRNASIFLKIFHSVHIFKRNLLKKREVHITHANQVKFDMEVESQMKLRKSLKDQSVEPLTKKAKIQNKELIRQRDQFKKSNTVNTKGFLETIQRYSASENKKKACNTSIIFEDAENQDVNQLLEMILKLRREEDFQMSFSRFPQVREYDQIMNNLKFDRKQN